MEKPANVQYYLRFASEGLNDDLREFMTIGGGVVDGIAVEAADVGTITSEEELKRVLAAQGHAQPGLPEKKKAQAAEIDDAFTPMPRSRPPLPKAPRADTAPVEGREGPRSSKAGGFDGGVREMAAVSNTQAMDVIRTEEMPPVSTRTMAPTRPEPKKTEAKAEAKTEAKAEPKTEAKAEPKTEAKAEPKTEAKAEAKTEVKAEAKTDAPAEGKKAKEEARDGKTRIGMPVDDDKKDPEKK
jgi:hypothetical protein